MTNDNIIDIKKQKKELERQADLTEEKYYKHFEGWKIRKIQLKLESTSGIGPATYPVLTLEHPDSDEVMEVYVQRDWEGNGPGVLVKGDAWIEEPTFEFDAGALSDIGDNKNET
tara:strand:- start:329 stop:670 length:342 start_codon:yes stop_codon:yes gene_type:complete